MTLYDQTKMTELERIQLLCKEILPAKKDKEMVAPWFVETPLKQTAQNMSKT